MKQRIITAIGIILAVVPPILLGGIYLQALLALFALVVIYEFLKVSILKNLYLVMMIIVTYIFLNLFVTTSYFSQTSIVLLLILFLINVISDDFNIEKIGYIFMLSFFTLMVLRAFLDIYHISKLIIVYLLIVTYITDSFAYFGGMLFGKHKLNQRISPKKTIEGSIIGYLFGLASGLLFGLNYLKLSTTLVVLASLIIPIFSQLGDLAMSSIKRHYGCKDFSNIFPGHGGVLDRIDSLTFSLLVFSVLIKVVN
ncbi:MAG: phosphatidate cytidylyltransferase [Erysipelotrichaceae bacterium]|nr:phosphatidate cytidylyltransferase [Erysipelotrichaceae bacterium]